MNVKIDFDEISVILMLLINLLTIPELHNDIALFGDMVVLIELLDMR